jgi:hypothetical protein
MWHSGLVKTDALIVTHVSFMSGVAADDTEARAMVRQLKAEGCCCISVTAPEADKIIHGRELKRWFAQPDIPAETPVRKARVWK